MSRAPAPSHIIDSRMFRDLYGTAEMRAVFTDEAVVAHWLEVEAALARAQAAVGLIPQDAAETITRCAASASLDLDVLRRGIETGELRADLDVSVSALQWVLDSYTLVLASLLILAGSTADRVGRRRTFQAGLALFTVGSLLCSVAPGLGWLIVFRTVQAAGALELEWLTVFGFSTEKSFTYCEITPATG